MREAHIPQEYRICHEFPETFGGLYARLLRPFLSIMKQYGSHYCVGRSQPTLFHQRQRYSVCSSD